MDVKSGETKGRELRTNRDGSVARMLQIEVTSADDIQSVEHITQSGEDTSPPNGSRVIMVSIGEAWKIAIAVDDLIQPEVAPGEKKLYSTNTDGDTVKAFIYLKGDGDVEVEASGNITATAAGSISAKAGTVLNMEAPIVNIITDALNVSKSGGGDATSTFQGGAAFVSGTITHDGVNIGKDHPHSDVENGPDTSGPPV